MYVSVSLFELLSFFVCDCVHLCVCVCVCVCVFVADLSNNCFNNLSQVLKKVVCAQPQTYTLQREKVKVKRACLP